MEISIARITPTTKSFEAYNECGAGSTHAGTKVGIIEAIAPNWVWVNREIPCNGTLIFDPAPKTSVAFAKPDRLKQSVGLPVAESFGIRTLANGSLHENTKSEGIHTDDLCHNTTAIDIACRNGLCRGRKDRREQPCQAGSSCHDGACECDTRNWVMCRDGTCRINDHKCAGPR